MRLLAETGEDLVGKHAVVIGQSNIVGRPMALELLMARCTVTICHSATRDLPAHRAPGRHRRRRASARPNFVQGDWIKPGAIVIDVGINRGADGKLVRRRRLRRGARVARRGSRRCRAASGR